MSSLSFFLVEGAGPLADDVVVGVEEDGGREGFDVVLTDDGAGLVGADGVGEAELLDELLALIHGVEAELLDSDEGDLVLVCLEGGLEVGHLKSARGARGIPEIEHDGLTLKGIRD